MEESILKTIKEALGIKDETYTIFDKDIILAINSAISTLTQLGVGPENGFNITGYDETWADLLTNSEKNKLEFVKTCIHLKTRLVFDPPSSSFVLDSIKNQISELEWRLNVAVDYTYPPK